MRYNDIMKIKKSKYEGYLWYSDESSPNILLGDKDLVIMERPEAYIVEGMLWDSASLTSIRIDYHDGQQHIYETEIKPEDLQGSEKTTIEEYIPHRLPGVSILSFLRYWQPVADPLCEGFEVLSPSSLVFVGFKKQ